MWWADFSRDGSMFCTCSDDRSVRVYDTKTWELLERLLRAIRRLNDNLIK